MNAGRLAQPQPASIEVDIMIAKYDNIIILPQALLRTQYLDSLYTANSCFTDAVQPYGSALRLSLAVQLKKRRKNVPEKHFQK